MQPALARALLGWVALGLYSARMLGRGESGQLEVCWRAPLNPFPLSTTHLRDLPCDLEQGLLSSTFSLVKGKQFLLHRGIVRVKLGNMCEALGASPGALRRSLRKPPCPVPLSSPALSGQCGTSHPRPRLPSRPSADRQCTRRTVSVVLGRRATPPGCFPTPHTLQVGHTVLSWQRSQPPWGG